MRIVLILALAAALAGCGAKRSDAGKNQAAAAPATAAGPADAVRLAQWREDSVRGCIGGARERVRDRAIPVERHCACAVDREMAGKTLAALEAEERSGAHETIFPAMLRQCIAEISPGYRPGG